MAHETDSAADPTPVSHRLFERAQLVLPGGVSYAIRDMPPYPFYVNRAFGSRLWDVDGNGSTDYWCGHGALILGHRPEAITAAVAHRPAARCPLRVRASAGNRGRPRW